MRKVNYIERPLTTTEYNQLRKTIGWEEKDVNAIEVGLCNSLYSICAIADNHVIGCGRVIGDGALYLYIQDVLVIPDYQRQGIGRNIMNHILNCIIHLPYNNIHVGLMAARGTESFYERLGFISRTSDRPGMFLIT